jgi:hypothetical protein
MNRLPKDKTSLGKLNNKKVGMLSASPDRSQKKRFLVFEKDETFIFIYGMI